MRGLTYPVYLGRQDEVALGEAVYDVGEDLHLHPSPGEAYVWMMALFFGYCSAAVHEGQRLPEVFEEELAPEVMLFYYAPFRKLMVKFFEFGTLQGRSISFARHASLIGEFGNWDPPPPTGAYQPLRLDT